MLGSHNLAFGRINGMATLTGFLYKKMYRRSAGTKLRGHNNAVTVFEKVTLRRGSTVLQLKTEKNNNDNNNKNKKQKQKQNCKHYLIVHPDEKVQLLNNSFHLKH